MEILCAVAIGFALDLIIGDPKPLPHPVRLIGFFISTGEKWLRKLCKTQRAELFGGVVLTLCVVSLSTALPLAVLWAASLVNAYVETGIHAIFCWQIMATKSLKVESMLVHERLAANDIEGARKYLSWIVGRDTERLTESQIAKATVETVAENASDGVVAPLLFMAVGGAPLGFLYKAVNTLDSMIGYKNDKYLYFGRFAAKLDDVVNFIPAIISAWFMIAASFVLRLDVKNAIRIFRRDRYNHASPNSAKTESVCAGALGVRLGGDSTYFGKVVHKATIGDDGRPIAAADIPLACRLMTATAVLAALVFLLIRLWVIIR